MTQIVGKDLLATALLKAQEALEPLINRGWGGEIGHNEVEQIINAGRGALTEVGLVLSRLSYSFEDRPPKPAQSQNQQYERHLVSNYELVHATSGRTVDYKIDLLARPGQEFDILLDRSLAILIRGLLLPAFETCEGYKKVKDC